MTPPLSFPRRELTEQAILDLHLGDVLDVWFPQVCKDLMLGPVRCTVVGSSEFAFALVVMAWAGTFKVTSGGGVSFEVVAQAPEGSQTLADEPETQRKSRAETDDLPFLVDLLAKRKAPRR